MILEFLQTTMVLVLVSTLMYETYIVYNASGYEDEIY